MKRFATLAVLVAFGIASAGCLYWPGGTNLDSVRRDVQMRNITTGDGTYENYVATGHYKGTEFGIGVGIPFLIKIYEFPFQTNEDLLKQVAQEAKDDGANGMINVTPHREVLTPFPFFFIGLYFDQAEGTGIKSR